MSKQKLKEYFEPGDGIDRNVINANIQKYLGRDATVRPGYGNGNQQGVAGYWIKAYRTFTTPMLQDLKNESARWGSEQQMTGTRAANKYEQSEAYRDFLAHSEDIPRRLHDVESSMMDPSYGHPQPRDQRMPTDRRPMYLDQSGQMQVDTSYEQIQDMRHDPSGPGYPVSGRAMAHDPYSGAPYQAYGRTVTAHPAPGLVTDPSHPSGYSRQPEYGNWPASAGPNASYVAAPAEHMRNVPGRLQDSQHPHGQPPQPNRQDQRDSRDPGEYGHAAYQDQYNSRTIPTVPNYPSPKPYGDSRPPPSAGDPREPRRRKHN